MNPSAINNAVAGSLSRIVSVILVPIVELVFATAVLLFVWGAAGLILHREDSDERARSWRHILWSLVGMFIMISCYGIIRIVANTIGVPSPF